MYFPANPTVDKIDGTFFLISLFGVCTMRWANATFSTLTKYEQTQTEISGIKASTKTNQITREQRAGLVDLLKDFKVTVTGFRPLDEAIVTSGGIKVSEVDPKTMKSKLVDGLYFAGEVLDLDADTGGYNLQTAFSTGYLAGQSAAKSLLK